ncbi:hypothetical protein ACFY5D_03765 [Paeniglutamicibacter sp. NPDC012692]|uniref:hypothetical protein n=1 Tax=Paeniglutamicibacter sp. NPDC012692 TaxID=3364388 RepID=UPI0036A772F1
MKQALKHRLTISMATVALVILAGTFVAGDTYPVAFAVIWVVYAVTLAFAVVSIRRDLKR